jgi:hypothetical protein
LSDFAENDNESENSDNEGYENNNNIKNRKNGASSKQMVSVGISRASSLISLANGF